MKKILFLAHVSGIGGSSFAMLNIIRNLDRSQYQPIVMLKSEGKLADELRKLDVEIHFIPTINQVLYNESFRLNRRCIALVKQFFQSIGCLTHWLKQNPVDVVYINSMMLYPYLLCAKRAGVRTVIHIRENWPEGEHKCQRKWAINNIKKYADEIIAINSFSASMFANSRRVTIVYDWVDFSNRYKPMPFDEIFQEDCSRLKVFLFLGGFNPIKGGKHVISAFVNNMKSPEYRLLVVGNSDTIMDNEVRKLLECDKRIKCIPPVYEIQDIVEQAYCMLSYFTMPHANLALAESIILNTPVVAARTPESVEYSLNGQLAQLFTLGDMKEFVKAIDETITDYESIKKNLIDNSSKIRMMFDKDENVRKIHEVLKTVTA